jgi:hypothetical protein
VALDPDDPFLGLIVSWQDSPEWTEKLGYPIHDILIVDKAILQRYIMANVEYIANAEPGSGWGNSDDMKLKTKATHIEFTDAQGNPTEALEYHFDSLSDVPGYGPVVQYELPLKVRYVDGDGRDIGASVNYVDKETYLFYSISKNCILTYQDVGL